MVQRSPKKKEKKRKLQEKLENNLRQIKTKTQHTETYDIQ